MERDEWLTVHEMAAIAKVDIQTVRRWLRDGKIPGRNLGGKTGWRVQAGDFESFMKGDEDGRVRDPQ